MFSRLAKHLNSHRVLYLVMYTVLSMTFESAAAQEPTVTAMAPATQAPDSKIQTAPVEVDGVTLFYVRGVSAFPAGRRAQETAKRIQTVAADHTVPPQPLRLQETPIGTQVLADSQPIMTVFDADARTDGVERQVSARVHLSRIGEAIKAYRYDRESRVLARHAQMLSPVTQSRGHSCRATSRVVSGSKL